MTMLRRAAVVGTGAVLGLVFGCEVIVPADVPDFTCGSISTSACPEGLVCDVLSGKCVPPVSGDDEGGPGDDGASGKDGDAKPDVKDGSDGSGPGALGAMCRFDVDCESKLCGTSTILTTNFTAAGPVCTKSCCTSADCPSGFICFTGGTGGNYCVSAAKAQRTPPSSGGGAAGATCVGSADCRSGLCSNTKCVDTCCVDADCTTGTVCAVTSVSTPAPAHFEFACVAPFGNRNNGTKCTDNTQCKNDNCVGFAGATCPACPRCAPACCKPSDCAAWAASIASDGTPLPSGATCAYGSAQGPGSEQIKWCRGVDAAKAPLDAPCASEIDCQSGYCDPEHKKCMLVCCKDSDCGIGSICSPSAVGTPYLRCVPGSR